MNQKHGKTNCVQFLEGGLPCEDCDLEGHPPACGWHRDWHSCDCGAFDPCTLTLEINHPVSHWDGDYYSRAYNESGIFLMLSEVVSHRIFSENSHISLLRDKELLDDYNRGDFKFKEFVADKMRQENENYGFLVSDLEMWDRKRGNLKMTAMVETTVAKLNAALQDQKLANEINTHWKVRND